MKPTDGMRRALARGPGRDDNLGVWMEGTMREPCAAPPQSLQRRPPRQYNKILLLYPRDG